MKLAIEQSHAPRIVTLDDHRDALATVAGGNLLDEGLTIETHDPTPRSVSLPEHVDASEAASIIAWSGSMAASDGEQQPQQMAAFLPGPDPRNWTGAGLVRLRERLESLRQPLEDAGRSLLIRPHAHHVISDIPTSVALLRDFGDGPFGLALSPAEMIVASMQPVFDDWFIRLFETLGSGAAMVFLADIHFDDDGEEAASATTVPLGAGCLKRDLVLDLLRTCVADEVPIVLRDESLQAQRRWLGQS